jgi:hypothetical protein
VIQEHRKLCRCCAEETPHRRDDWDGDQCIPCNERLSAEIVPKECEGLAAYAVRMMDMDRRERQRLGLPVFPVSEKSYKRKRRERLKALELSASEMRKGSDPPLDKTDPAFVEHMRKITEKREKDFEKGPMRLMASDVATRERAARDPEYKEALKHTPESRRAAYMVKPWKGRAGRDAVKETGTTTARKLSKREHAIELDQKGHTEVEIGKIIDRDPRTVRRYLNGR